MQLKRCTARDEQDRHQRVYNRRGEKTRKKRKEKTPTVPLVVREGRGCGTANRKKGAAWCGCQERSDSQPNGQRGRREEEERGVPCQSSGVSLPVCVCVYVFVHAHWEGHREAGRGSVVLTPTHLVSRVCVHAGGAAAAVQRVTESSAMRGSVGEYNRGAFIAVANSFR